LLGDVKPFGSVGILILASEELSEDGIISDERVKGGLSLGGCGDAKAVKRRTVS
jgi:hypothetical protein